MVFKTHTEDDNSHYPPKKSIKIDNSNLKCLKQCLDVSVDVQQKKTPFRKTKQNEKKRQLII